MKTQTPNRLKQMEITTSTDRLEELEKLEVIDRVLTDPKKVLEAKESIKAVAQQVLSKKRLRKGLRL
jgi:glycerol-3-phosphate cytidylyltransferase-like family protein